MYAVKTERKRPVERPRNRREGNVKVDRKGVEWLRVGSSGGLLCARL
jgi:hypothetical protein